MMESLLREGEHHRVFIVGDASMAPYELHGAWMGKSGFDYLREMAAAFPRLAWLNPVSEGAWGRTETIDDIRTVIKMFPANPQGNRKGGDTHESNIGQESGSYINLFLWGFFFFF